MKKLFLQMVKISTISFVLLMAGIVQVSATEQEDSGKDHYNEAFHHQALKIHLDMYVELLAEKYAPDQINSWNEIRKEREMLMKKYREAEKKGKISGGNKMNHKWFAKHKEIHQQFSSAVEKRDEKEIKAALEKILQHQKEKNELLKKQLDEIEQ